MSVGRQSVHSVFATSPYWTTALRGGQPRREPAAQVHAKVMGTTATLCGQPTVSWTKFWDINFAAVTNGRCLQCVDALLYGARRT